MSYENPINVMVNNICSDIQKKEDEYFMECVHKVGVDVNKEELIRALQYDRQQYEKGYKDGFDKALKMLDTEINQLTSRYSISKERGGMGQVEWSDKLIKESDILQIIDRLKESD